MRSGLIFSRFLYWICSHSDQQKCELVMLSCGNSGEFIEARLAFDFELARYRIVAAAAAAVEALLADTRTPRSRRAFAGCWMDKPEHDVQLWLISQYWMVCTQIDSPCDGAGCP